MSTISLFATDWRDVWQNQGGPEGVGSVYTRTEIVDFILDLAGYRAQAHRLADRPLLEPSCGDGAFLSEIVARLLESERIHAGAIEWGNSSLDSAICATDISERAISTARTSVANALVSAGCQAGRAAELASHWIIQTDFLLTEWSRRFAIVVGNPPYVRLEALPRRVLQEYRARFETLTDRADLYVAFFEQGLELLDDDGCLAFICANRFTKNQYGSALRRLIASRYRVRQYVNLEHTQPFLQDVSAYPAVVVIDRKTGGPTRSGELPNLEPATLASASAQALGPRCGDGALAEFPSWYPDGSPWRSTSASTHAFMDRLDGLPALEASAPGTKVGIGVATGADEVFVLPAKRTDIEESRQIPLLMAEDVGLETCTWSGHYLVNPFDSADDGNLVNLEEFPGLKSYFGSREAQLNARHVARTRPARWYRTIDRVWPSLQRVQKLVIPDIQTGGVVGLDGGEFYPHHNLYWISSPSWDLRALQALLRSSFVLNQVRAYSVQMRGEVYAIRLKPCAECGFRRWRIFPALRWPLCEMQPQAAISRSLTPPRQWRLGSKWRDCKADLYVSRLWSSGSTIVSVGARSTRMTSRSPSRSSGYSNTEVIRRNGHGGASRTSNSPYSNGWLGLAPTGCWNRWASFRRPSTTARSTVTKQLNRNRRLSLDARPEKLGSIHRKN